MGSARRLPGHRLRHDGVELGGGERGELAQEWVGRVAAPTLCLSAEDDPFLPAETLDRVAARASGAVRLVRTRHGGHTGFIAGASPFRVRYWAEERAAEFVAARLTSPLSS